MRKRDCFEDRSLPHEPTDPEKDGETERERGHTQEDEEVRKATGEEEATRERLLGIS